MSPPDNIIAKKLATALLKDAELGDRTSRMVGAGGRMGAKASKLVMGGHWVGGTLYLTDNYVEFHPNTLNKAVHKDPESLNVFIPLRGITGVEVRNSVGTQVIDVHTAIGTLSVRCLGASGFAKKINAARAD
ncbi:MAG: hypothetical protein VXW22_03505 [Pseudomonadota bacterium]|nr:hypothetical protein [Pseudomonadota bacterium]